MSAGLERAREGAAALAGLLDDAGPLVRMRIAGELSAKAAQYKAGGLSAFERIKLARDIQSLLAQLGATIKPEAGEPGAIVALRKIAAGAIDGESLAELFGRIQEAVNALTEAGQLDGDAESVAHAAITHWAELESMNVAA